MFAGLPELGISNGEDLKETLTNCTEPLKAIDQFQVTLTMHQVFDQQQIAANKIFRIRVMSMLPNIRRCNVSLSKCLPSVQ